MMAMPDSGSTSWGKWTIAVLAVLLLFRILALYFNSTGLMFDEAQYWLWGKEPAFGYFSKPPLLGWIIGVFTAACGSDSEFCVRLPASVIHTGTALLIYLITCRLFDRRTAFWAAVIFATLPGISYSVSFITTDVPLLFCWAGALLTFLWLRDQSNWANAVYLGLFLGAGLMAKYAMAYFLMCAFFYALIDGAARRTVASGKFLLSILVALVIVSPNIWWNANNGFVTASHTNKNIGWLAMELHPDKAIEFLASQFAVFGPILLIVFLLTAIQLIRGGSNDSEKFLLVFSLPMLLLLTFQGLMSKAYANWAAATYVAATILVSNVLANRIPPIWNRLSISIHTVVLVLVSLVMIYSAHGELSLIAEMKFMKRLQGWREIAQVSEAQLEKADYSAVIAPGRHLTSEMVYYLRHRKEMVFAFRTSPDVRDHYELTRTYKGDPQGAVLLISTSASVKPLESHFKSIESLGTAKISAGKNHSIWFFRLADFQPPKPD